MVRTFRFEPPIPARPLVHRPRLGEVLDRRFDARVTTVVAGAGFGKTTLVAGALRANLAARRGDDCWLTCEPADVDARHLAADLWAALHVEGELPTPPLPSGEHLAAAIAEAIWVRAPRHVAVVLDDVHELVAGSSGAAFIDDLIDAMAANGHLVLISRVEPPLALTRLRAHGDVVDLTERDLAFTEHELAEFASLRQAGIDHLARVGGWPALAELAASARSDDVDGFLFEEVLARRSPADVETIEVLALLGGGDHALLGALLDRPVSPATLAATLGDVPMASRDAEGWWTLHPLWTRAIEDRMDPRRRGEVVRRAGRALQHRHPSRAIELLATADAGDELRTAIRTLLETPWAAISVERLLGLHRRLPADVATSAEAELLLAAATSATAPAAALGKLRAIADQAEAAGDHRLGLLAVERLVVITHRRQDIDGLIDAFTRAHRLAHHDEERADALVVLGDALLAEAAGDATRVLALLDRLHAEQLDAYWRAPIAWMRAQALLALGHPEAALPHSAFAVETAPPALRGEVAMLHVNVLAHSGRVESALEQIPTTIALLDQYGTVDARTMAHGQAAQRYAMNGLVDPAREHLTIALDLAGPDRAAPLRATLAAAEAILAVAELDEDRARAIMSAALADQPLGIGRQQYHERRRLALSYVLLPETRPFWDAEALGPAFAVTRESTRALVALRERSEVRPAGRLDTGHWADAPATLPMPWMVELALAGVADGSDDATMVLKSLPTSTAPVLKHVAASTGVRAVARSAAAALAALPHVPDRPLRIEALGPLTLRLGDAVVDEPNWRRERVRMLLAHLVTRRRATREEVATALWPDLDSTAADRNLRVTLSYLHSVLEPGRTSGTPPYFVRTDGGQLVLADLEMLTVDVDEFLHSIDRAAEERRHGSPAVELEHLLGATDRYRGTFLVDLGPEEWVLDARDRLRAQFVAAAVRAGELALAGGDVERARALADRAIEEEPWSEQARRLLVTAHLERGDRAAARRALDACLAMLAELGVGPEVETDIVARRLRDREHPVHGNPSPG